MTRIHVTDHALLRYIERKYKISAEIFRREIESQCRIAIGAQLNSLAVDDLRFLFSAPDPLSGTVTVKTVLDRTMKTKRRPTRLDHK